ncbi:hypothetical protein AVEN_213556-1 [Araneus ventricosus]|uniref:Uncharacterized protein n=1 Tax=Araneus ventricosus TaxID=182803 RepID=A0A4Y2JND6_ARAVE|nr:hypothetical protein AVEN_213556-1 [Araneus ventricosus]
MSSLRDGLFYENDEDHVMWRDHHAETGSHVCVDGSREISGSRERFSDFWCTNATISQFLQSLSIVTLALPCFPPRSFAFVCVQIKQFLGNFTVQKKLDYPDLYQPRSLNVGCSGAGTHGNSVPAEHFVETSLKQRVFVTQVRAFQHCLFCDYTIGGVANEMSDSYRGQFASELPQPSNEINNLQ